MYEVLWTKQAKKDHCRISRSKVCAERLVEILNVVRQNPFEETPGHNFERLKNYKPSTYTRRLDYTNRNEKDLNVVEV
jgi:Txe/YoeB family toxin of Txe-Axe toxin-antitoxin module